jgi:hypothetical protein
MPDTDDIPRRRGALVLDVTQAAAKVSDLIHEARALNLTPSTATPIGSSSPPV